jgi:hypothetical protein
MKLKILYFILAKKFQIKEKTSSIFGFCKNLATKKGEK